MIRFILILFVSQVGFSQENTVSFSDKKCWRTYITFFDSSSVVKEVTTTCFFDIDEEECDLLEICFNEYNWLAYNKTIDVYSRSFKNYWYKNGMPNRILSFYQDSLIVYNHYSEVGKLIGQEFFKHNINTQTFFIYTGTWWKMDGEIKREITNHPISYESSYFDY